MTDIATWFKVHFKHRIGENLSRLISDQEKATSKPYYIKLEPAEEGYFVGISSDNDKHLIEFPKQVLNKIKSASVAEIIVAHEILHTKLEAEGFRPQPFDATWKNMVYNLVVDLVINRMLLPERGFDYGLCVYQFNLKCIEIDTKRGFAAPPTGHPYERAMAVAGQILSSRWFWSLSNPTVKKILRVMKRRYTNSALGDIYKIMCDRLDNISEITSYPVAYEKAKNLSDEIEAVFRTRGVSFTEVSKRP
jgi:hypothetical protein